jgi:hypothetical protein
MLMRRRFTGSTSFLAAALAGCFTASFPLTVSTTKPLTPKPPGCDFQIAALLPQGGYEEVGTIRSAGKGVDDPSELKRAIQADVCRVGGDVVVTDVNGYGNYVRGVVLHKVP